MKQETNNEMDLLLRRLGRRQDAPASSDHLDADELSSYAENVLPAAARARYTEHLAECMRCRELVVQLSSSAGVVVAQESVKVSAPSALRKFLASLFSPMVLRYAVPALGLVVVAAIGFIVSRQQPRSESPVAQVTQQDRAQAPVPASEPQSTSSPGTFTDSPETRTSTKAVPQNNSAAQPVPAPSPNAPSTVSPVTAEVQQDKEAKKVAQQPAEANVAPAAPKSVAVTDQSQKLEAEVEKQKLQDRVAVANEPPPEKAAKESKTEDRKSEDVAAARSRSARREAAPLGVGSVESAGSRTLKRDDDAEKDKNDADTRTVAGRRFRKQGGVWIDTAYNSSRGAMDLPRGSEQYRSLVADEPAIKTIADQLDGEIIVVWKGRTYRIR